MPLDLRLLAFAPVTACARIKDAAGDVGDAPARRVVAHSTVCALGVSVGITEEARKRQVAQALATRLEQAEADRHSHPLPWRGAEKYFPVVSMPLDIPLLNADSHRIRAELEAPDYRGLRTRKTSDEAQAVLASLWRTAHRKFEQLKESLQVDGQTEPGVMTRAGVMINGNTRLVALRELNDPNRQWIRVAVLDSDATAKELAQLELRLQVRDPLRDSYKLSNELLFVEEMAREYDMSDEAIALSLGWNPLQPAAGRKRVALHRRLLDLIREMQTYDPLLPVTFFDDKLQQLKELEQRYNDVMANEGSTACRQLLETWVLVARSGYSSVHQIRAVTRSRDFVGDYLVPRLSEQEMFAETADELLAPAESSDPDVLPGLEELGLDPGDDPIGYNLRPLVDVVEEAVPGPVELPGLSEAVAVEAAKDAITCAVDGAVKDYRADDKAEDELAAPVEALRKAGSEIKKATAAYKELRHTQEFERTSKAKFAYQLKHVRRYLRDLEDLAAEQPN